MPDTAPVASVDALRSAVTTFGDAIDTAAPDAPVPSCPDWTVADLVGHLGWVHQWAAGAIREGRSTDPADPVPDGPDDLTPWYRRHATDLVDLLESTPHDEAAWTFSREHPTAAFWLRRQVHETVVHTWDLLGAAGSEPALDPALSWDGVQEVRDVFYPRQVALGRTEPLPAALVLRATDVAGEPVVLGDGEQHEVPGVAADLLLALWKRGSLETSSEVAVLLDRALTP